MPTSCGTPRAPDPRRGAPSPRMGSSPSASARAAHPRTPSAARSGRVSGARSRRPVNLLHNRSSISDVIRSRPDPATLGRRQALRAAFARTNDRPILNIAGRFWLLRAPGGIVAAYRKCTHLGCAVPFNDAEDRFHCPCHGSQYDKRTAVVLRIPAPKPLQLFHITESAQGQLIVDTNPLRVIDRTGEWDPSVIEISDSA